MHLGFFFLENFINNYWQCISNFLTVGIFKIIDHDIQICPYQIIIIFKLFLFILCYFWNNKRIQDRKLIVMNFNLKKNSLKVIILLFNSKAFHKCYQQRVSGSDPSMNVWKLNILTCCVQTVIIVSDISLH